MVHGTIIPQLPFPTTKVVLGTLTAELGHPDIGINAGAFVEFCFIPE
jgi:hypothetical protein